MEECTTGGYQMQNDDKKESINTAISSIDNLEYQQIIIKLIQKKLRLIQDSDTFIIKNKVAQYIINKGFESYIVWDEINNHIDG